MLDRVCLASFRDHRIWHARKELGNGLCTSAGRVAVVRQILRGKGLPMKKSNAAVLQVPLRKFGVNVVTPQFLKKAHRDGHFVHVWTVNAKEDMHRLLEMGVDGIMTDRPRLLRSVMEERGEWILADN
jgi:glycerophosphoryl diester phosphodiesterase